MDGKIATFGEGALIAERGGPCPYGMPRGHGMRFFRVERCDEGSYERAMAEGWRRSGMFFYQNACELGCASCVPIRVDARAIVPTKAQRRAIRMNGDLSLSLSVSGFSREDFVLFRAYLAARHPEDARGFDEEAYCRSYLCSPVEGAIARYRTADGRLVALGFIDVLADGFSSVYFAFDPAESRRSLGVYSVFAECSLLASMGKRWYYLGFWVAGCRKMEYKAGFRPHELAREGRWVAGPVGDAGIRSRAGAGSGAGDDGTQTEGREA